ncbi:MAG TPA: polysaccharide biosynthesis tyrosine autokinase [Chthonomonadaceae bacterium]|nr:polysaccharide biosynthesis tyrosine autokinase [Chthonomonadaceae bacterium]
MQDETLGQGEVSLRDYLDLLRRRSATILYTAALVLIVGIIIALVSRPVYSASGRLLVTQQNPQLEMNDLRNPFAGALTTSAGHNIETQIQVLTTSELMGDAYKASGQMPGDPRINVSISSEKDIDIINITTEAPTATAAADVTNNLMNLYIKQESDRRNKDLDTAIQFAEDQLKEANAAWARAASELKKFQDNNQVTDLDKAATAQYQLVSDLETKEHDAQTSLDGAQAQIETVKKELAALPANVTVTTSATNPQIAALKAQLDGLNADLQSALAKFRPDHPTVKQLEARIDSLKATLAATPATVPSQSIGPNPALGDLQTQLRKLETDRAGYAAALAGIRAKKAAAIAQLQKMGGSTQFQQAKLMQDRDLAQETVKDIQSRLSDMRIRRVATSSPITIISNAAINPNPVRPKRLLIILMSLVAGLFLGACLALLQEFMDDRVNTPEDARRLVSIPALGYIPNIEREDQRLLTAGSTGGSVLESYRLLRSNVRFAAVDESLQSILVTSTVPGEGKSVTACNLAVAMALDGKKVILVDADLRRPTIHEKFGLRSTPGLTNVLVGAMDVDDALQATNIENLRLLTSGPIPPNPAELLNSRAMEQVQEMLKARSDIVIFDSPPCLSVADAQVLAATVDGLIYVIQLGSTKKTALRHGYELLRQAHARILGVVYNKIPLDGGRSGYYYGYYSYYHKAELPGKSNGASNGHSERIRRRRSEWEELAAAAKERSAALVVREPARTQPSASAEKGVETNENVQTPDVDKV